MNGECQMNGLWSFSVMLYGADEVKQLCLTLQDEEGIDVCLLLSLVWLGTHGISLDRSSMTSLYYSVLRWQLLVTTRLRRYRLSCQLSKSRFSKSIFNPLMHPLYSLLKILELTAEKASFWRINCFLKERFPLIIEDAAHPKMADQITTEQMAVAMQYNLASYFEIDANDRRSTLQPEQITAILLNYLPR